MTLALVFLLQNLYFVTKVCAPKFVPINPIFLILAAKNHATSKCIVIILLQNVLKGIQHMVYTCNMLSHMFYFYSVPKSGILQIHF
jgi:hypothetical protein